MRISAYRSEAKGEKRELQISDPYLFEKTLRSRATTEWRAPPKGPLTRVIEGRATGRSVGLTNDDVVTTMRS